MNLGRETVFDRRAGFTLVELCVVLSIVALSAALLAAAVMSSRAAARGVQCRDRLRQIGLALHSHIATHGSFPIGNSETGWGTHVHLLPFLEQRPLYDRFDRDVSWIDWQSENAEWYYETVSPTVFHCPDDPATGSGLAVNYLPSAGVPWHGLSSGLFPQEPYGKLKAGRDARPAISPGDVRDGLGQTVAFTEILAPDYTTDPRRTLFRVRWGRGAKTDRDAWFDYIDSCLAGEGAPEEPTTLGTDWLNGTIGYSRLTHTVPPNSKSCSKGDPAYGVYAPSSDHRDSGIHVLLADGAVRPVAGDVDQALWQAAGTRSEGEVAALFE